MPPLYWNLDTGVVSLQRYNQTALRIESNRGAEPLQVILVRGTPPVPVQLDATESVGIVIRDPDDLKAGCLGGPTLLTRGSDATLGYSGSVSTDTTFTRSQMHSDPADAVKELPSYPVEAVFYHVSGAGDDSVESFPFDWTILPNYYRPLQPPADVVETYPPAANLLTTGNVGTTAGKLVALDGSAKLPAVDGSQLLNLPTPPVGVTSANVIGIRKSAGAGSTDTAASGADMASLLAGTNLVPSSLLSATIGSPTGVDLNLIAGTYGSGGSIRIYANGTSIATLNGGTGEAHFNYDVQAGGNLIASGTITGNEVYRTVSGTVTAVVSASGSTPADKVIGCHRIPGAVSLTIPTLGLPQNASREFVIFDADNVGTSNPVTVHVADTGDTKTFSASGFVAHLRISRDVDGGSIFLTVS